MYLVFIIAASQLNAPWPCTSGLIPDRVLRCPSQLPPLSGHGAHGCASVPGSMLYPWDRKVVDGWGWTPWPEMRAVTDSNSSSSYSSRVVRPGIRRKIRAMDARVARCRSIVIVAMATTQRWMPMMSRCRCQKPTNHVASPAQAGLMPVSIAAVNGVDHRALLAN